MVDKNNDKNTSKDNKYGPVVNKSDCDQYFYRKFKKEILESNSSNIFKIFL